MRWKIYYEGGATFSDLEGLPREAPAYGVLCIGQEGSDNLISGDYYLYRADYGVWIETKLDGLVEHLVVASDQVVAVRVGRAVPTWAWKIAVQMMSKEF